MKTCKANGAPVGAFVEFEGRQMLVVDNDTIHKAIKQWLTGDIDGVCTTYVTDMRELFCNVRDFNQHLDDWDTSNVITMNSMFFRAESFNQPIGYQM